MDGENMGQGEQTPEPKSVRGGLLALGAVAVIVILIGVFLLTQDTKKSQSSEEDATMEQEMTVPESSVPETAAPESGTGEAAAPASDEDAAVKTFTVEAKSFSFTPNEIRVKKGDRVKIVLKNTGGMHDFVIDELGVRTKVIKGGEEDTVEFTADQAGTFEFYCSVMNHRAMGMVGKFIVE
jgi:nitrosocyanin